jgi:hypothetical protein
VREILIPPAAKLGRFLAIDKSSLSWATDL